MLWNSYPPPQHRDIKPKTLAQQVAQLARDPKAAQLADAYGGLKIMEVTWEDCGRWKDSCYGPNISDLTLQCADDETRMPIIRRPNFSDVTADISIDNFMLTVGNENGTGLTKVNLRDFLKNIDKYTGNPNIGSMYLDRDEKILTSTQACILPLRDGKVEFNVTLFNYQYDEIDPAVLCIVANQTGTSVQAITKPNQSLYFNDNGKAANFVAQRLSDHRAATGSTATGAMTQSEKEANVLFVFQIPLKQTRVKRSFFDYEPVNACLDGDSPDYVPECALYCSAAPRGFEDAILTTGKTHSEFEGVGKLKLVRDDRFAIRCTTQFYNITDTIEIPAEVFKNLGDKLNKPYSSTTEKGSLVIEKDTGRITEHIVEKPKVIPSSGPSIWY